MKTKNKNFKLPFSQTVDLDSVTIICPCGAAESGEGEIIGNFIKKHKKHTNGECKENISNDGMRVLSSDTKRNRTYKVK